MKKRIAKEARLRLIGGWPRRHKLLMAIARGKKAGRSPADMAPCQMRVPGKKTSSMLRKDGISPTKRNAHAN